MRDMIVKIVRSARLLFAIFVFAVRTSAAEHPAVVLREFIYETAPFPSCHAATLAESSKGLVAAWFGGTKERNPDVTIWTSIRDARGWSALKEVGTGVQADGTRFPCWNPVLHQVPGGPLLLFFKVGPSPHDWWGMLTKSFDGGTTWTSAEKLPEGILGPIKNKPLQLNAKTILCGSSTEVSARIVHLEFFSLDDITQGTGTWTKSEPLNDGKEMKAIQPTLLRHPGGVLQLLARGSQERIVESWSSDEGKTWSPLANIALPNPDAGLDAVGLADGRFVLVYNHDPKERIPLHVAVSGDGKLWSAVTVLETEPEGQHSYPAVIQTADGLVHTAYTFHRKKIAHVVLDPSKLTGPQMPTGEWPK
jgi:predicted neuraminidase